MRQHIFPLVFFAIMIGAINHASIVTAADIGTQNSWKLMIVPEKKDIVVIPPQASHGIVFPGIFEGYFQMFESLVDKYEIRTPDLGKGYSYIISIFSHEATIAETNAKAQSFMNHFAKPNNLAEKHDNGVFFDTVYDGTYSAVSIFTIKSREVWVIAETSEDNERVLDFVKNTRQSILRNNVM